MKKLFFLLSFLLLISTAHAADFVCDNDKVEVFNIDKTILDVGFIIDIEKTEATSSRKLEAFKNENRHYKSFDEADKAFNLVCIDKGINLDFTRIRENPGLKHLTTINYKKLSITEEVVFRVCKDFVS